MIALETPILKSTSDALTDAFIKTSPVILVGNQAKIKALDFVWRTNKNIFTNTEDFTTTINEAVNGYFRNDIIVTNNLGGFDKLEGDSSNDPSLALEPTVPAGTLKVTTISVFGSEFTLQNDIEKIGEEKLNRNADDTFTGELTIDGDLILKNQKNVVLGSSQNVTSAQFAAFADNSYLAKDFCIDANNNIYVAQYAKNKIVKITPTGVVSDFANTTGQSPLAIRIDNTGNLYVLNSGNPPNRDFTKITPAGVATKIPLIVNWAEYFLLHSNGEIWIPDHSRVNRFSVAGAFLGYYDTQDFNSSAWGMGICQDLSGNVYVAFRGTNKVAKITTAGVVTQNFASVGAYPMGICVDANGFIYTANKDDNTVSKISPAGVVITINVGTAPTDVIATADGKVYVTNSGSNNVSVILPDNSTFILANTGDMPLKITKDNQGNLFVLDSNSAKLTDVYKISIPTTTGKPRFLTTDENGKEFLKELPFGQSDLDLKVDKVAGKSLIADTEIARLAGVTNVDISGKADKLFTPVTQAGLTYTLKTADLLTQQIFTNANPVTVTVPTDAADNIPIGSEIRYTQQGTGVVTISAPGVTITTNISLASVQGETRTLRKIAANSWTSQGNIAISGAKVPYTVFVDTVNGVDATGQLQDSTKPFKTDSAAYAALPSYDGNIWILQFLCDNVTRSMSVIPNRKIKIFTKNKGTFSWLNLGASSLCSGTHLEIETERSDLIFQDTIATSLRPTEYLKIIAKNIYLKAQHTGGYGFFGWLPTNSVDSGYINCNIFEIQAPANTRLFEYTGDFICNTFSNKTSGIALYNSGQSIWLRFKPLNVVTTGYALSLSLPTKTNHKIMSFAGDNPITDNTSLNLDVTGVTFTCPTFYYLAGGVVSGKMFNNTFQISNAYNIANWVNFQGRLPNFNYFSFNYVFKNCTIYVASQLSYTQGDADSTGYSMTFDNSSVIQDSPTYLFNNQKSGCVFTIKKIGSFKTNATSLYVTSGGTGSLTITDLTPNTF